MPLGVITLQNITTKLKVSQNLLLYWVLKNFQPLVQASAKLQAQTQPKLDLELDLLALANAWPLSLHWHNYWRP